MSDLAVWARAIGQTIRRLRISQGLTQAELAGEHFSKSYISQLERGSVTPSLRALDILAERLGVPTTFFIEATGQYASFLLKIATIAFFTGDIERARALAEEIGKNLEHLRMRERIEYQLLLIRLAGKAGRWTDVHATCRGLEELLAQSPYRSPAITVPFNYWWGKAWLAEGNRRQATRRWEIGLNQLRDNTAPPPEEGLHLMVELADLYRQLGDPHSSDLVTSRALETLNELSNLEGLSRWFLSRCLAALDKQLNDAAERTHDAEEFHSGVQDRDPGDSLHAEAASHRPPASSSAASSSRRPPAPASPDVDRPSRLSTGPDSPGRGMRDADRAYPYFAASGSDVIAEVEAARDAEAWARALATLEAAQLIRQRLSKTNPDNS